MNQCANGSPTPEYEYVSVGIGFIKVSGDLISQAQERLLKVTDRLLGEATIAVNSFSSVKTECSGAIGEIIKLSDDNNIRLQHLLQIIAELEKL